MQEKARAAMLSVYYHSIGSRLELRGAPAIMVSPEVRPLELGEALRILDSAGRLRDAIWTLARAVPPSRPGETIPWSARYPRELLAVVADRPEASRLKRFDERRTAYREDASLFSMALTAFARSQTSGDVFDVVFDTILRQIERDGPDALCAGRTMSLDNATRKPEIFGDAGFLGYLQTQLGVLTGKDRDEARERLRRLEQELGINLETYLQEFADAVAFDESFPGETGSELTVLPASSITVQDARTLQTQVTVTALVHAKNFDCLLIAMDPQCWSLCSEAFIHTRYVTGPFDLTPLPNVPAPGSYTPQPKPTLLEERVRISWGADGTEIASFHNILNISKLVGNAEGIDIRFNLARSISSRILWDERAGGMLVNEGYIKARRVMDDVWRVTTRKTIRFSDRTPYAGGPGWNDFGQVLNYLTPAALAWWIETELYSATCPKVLKAARNRQAGKHNATGPERPTRPKECS